MPCYHPLDAWRFKGEIKFTPPGSFLRLPCGQCIGCRLERSRQWAIRCVHEASLYEDNCFITLTYSPEHFPVHGSLDVRDFQLFMKRLRKACSGSKIRFFHCGEYGERSWRPHYHACLFNFDVPDRKLYTVRDGVRLYTSEFLESIWKKGFVTVGDVTFESAAYVARYITKKVNGARAEAHYSRVDESTGELYQLAPEYTTMSRRPGIGRDWYAKYAGDVFPEDEVVMRGRRMKPPRFYSTILEQEHEEIFAEVKASRERAIERCKPDSTRRRLLAREQVKLAQFKMLKRGLDNDS